MERPQTRSALQGSRSMASRNIRAICLRLLYERTVPHLESEGHIRRNGLSPGAEPEGIEDHCGFFVAGKRTVRGAGLEVAGASFVSTLRSPHPVIEFVGISESGPCFSKDESEVHIQPATAGQYRLLARYWAIDSHCQPALRTGHSLSWTDLMLLAIRRNNRARLRTSILYRIAKGGKQAAEAQTSVSAVPWMPCCADVFVRNFYAAGESNPRLPLPCARRGRFLGVLHLSHTIHSFHVLHLPYKVA